MKLKLDTKIKGSHGEILGKNVPCMTVREVERNGKKTVEPIPGLIGRYSDVKLERTLKDQLQSALLHNLDGKDDNDQKLKKWRMLQRLEKSNGSIELENSDLQFLQECNSAYEPDIYIFGFVNDLLEAK